MRTSVVFVVVAAACAWGVLGARLRARDADNVLQPASVFSSDFLDWEAKFDKRYPTTQARLAAFETFRANDAVIAALNADPSDKAQYGHTVYSDITPESFAARFTQGRPMNAEEGKRGAAVAEVDAQKVRDMPASFDWRDQNAVSPVKDQGPCGSCWAESAVQNVESVVYIASKDRPSSGPTPLSTEQVVECDPHDYACYGGYPSGAFEYILEQGGLATQDSYPYDLAGHVICLANQTFNETCGDGMCDDPPLTGFCDLTCSADNHTLVASISNWNALPTDEDKLAAFVAASNPVSVALDASGRWGALLPWLQFYKGGVASPKHCSTTVLDHAVLIVGYGTDGDTPYWTVKNSWGAKWGEDGYFRIVRGQGMCGINTLATTAVA